MQKSSPSSKYHWLNSKLTVHVSCVGWLFCRNSSSWPWRILWALTAARFDRPILGFRVLWCSTVERADVCDERPEVSEWNRLTLMDGWPGYYAYKLEWSGLAQLGFLVIKRPNSEWTSWRWCMHSRWDVVWRFEWWGVADGGFFGEVRLGLFGHYIDTTIDRQVPAGHNSWIVFFENQRLIVHWPFSKFQGVSGKLTVNPKNDCNKASTPTKWPGCLSSSLPPRTF